MRLPWGNAREAGNMSGGRKGRVKVVFRRRFLQNPPIVVVVQVEVNQQVSEVEGPWLLRAIAGGSRPVDGLSEMQESAIIRVGSKGRTQVPRPGPLRGERACSACLGGKPESADRGRLVTLPAARARKRSPSRIANARPGRMQALRRAAPALMEALAWSIGGRR